MKLKNKHLKELDEHGDTLYHLGIDTNTTDVKEKFGDVKLVCISGSVSRVENFAKCMNAQLKVMDEKDIKNLCTGDRYVMYKVGKVLMANHGMGTPSISILLEELFKLLYHAGAKEVTFFRLGTSGGVGLQPGTVVLTNEAVNGYFEPIYTQIVLGKRVDHDTKVRNTKICEELQRLSKQMTPALPFEVVRGKTMCCDDFYEAQGRSDGAFCAFEESDKKEFLQTAYNNGVRNIEMESLAFMAMCNRAEVEAAVICVVLVDRLLGDQVKLTSKEKSDFEQQPFWIILEYVKNHLK